MTISPDSQAILLLCSHIGLLSNSEYSSLTLKEWNPLAKKLQSISMRPGDLLGLTPEEIQNQLGINLEEAERYYHLLQRSGSLAIELERLASLGILVLTRADQEYPTRYRQRLKESAPAVLFYAGERASPDISAECVVPDLPPELSLVSLKTWFDILDFYPKDECFNLNPSTGIHESTYTRRYAEIEFAFNNTDPESYYALFLIGSPKYYRNDIQGIGLGAPNFMNYGMTETNANGFFYTFKGGLTIQHYCQSVSYTHLTLPTIYSV